METIETPSVSSGPVYAGFWRRFVGWLIDLLILIVITHWVLVLVSSFLTTPIPDTLSFSAFFSALWPTALALIVVNFIIITLYYSLLESSSIQSTVGKYIAGLKITTIEDSRISFRKAFVRRIYSLLSIIPIFIGYIVAGFTARKQTFHDMLGKTVVIVNKPKKSIVLIGIVILTIIAGILSDMYLGAGFHISFNSPGVHYDTQSGLQKFTVQKGNEVDPVLQKTIIDAFLNRKALFESGNLSKIRQYLLDGTPATAQKQITDMSESDLQKLVGFFNQVQGLTTESMLRSPNTVWTFSKSMDSVRIKAEIPNANAGDINSVTIDMSYVNGLWY